MHSRTRQTTTLHTGIAVRWPASIRTNPDYSEMPRLTAIFTLTLRFSALPCAVSFGRQAWPHPS